MGGAGGDSGLCAKRRRVSAGADVRSMSTQEPLGRAVQRTLWAEARGLAGLALLRRPRASHARPPAVPEEEAGVNEASEERRPRKPRRGPPPGDCAPRKRWPFPSPGDLPYPGIELGSLALQADSLPTEPSQPSSEPSWQHGYPDQTNTEKSSGDDDYRVWNTLSLDRPCPQALSK